MPQAAAEAAPASGEPFIPPQAERVVRAAAHAADRRAAAAHARPDPRQPRRAEPAAAAPEQKRMTLLQRLATVGFGGRKEEPAAPAAPAEVPPQPSRRQRPNRSQRQPVAGACRICEAAGAARLSPGARALDAQGRVTPPQRSIEDEQLEIPAFLRRQAN